MHFVLDQNFPFQATGLPWPPGLTVSSLRAIDPQLTRDHDDWEIFRALHRRGAIDGFITNDANILDLPREMVMLSRTQLLLVVTAGLGHDPLGATGLLMVHLPQIAKQMHPKPHIYILKRGRLTLTNVRTTVDKLAQRTGVTPSDLVKQELAEIARKV